MIRARLYGSLAITLLLGAALAFAGEKPADLYNVELGNAPVRGPRFAPVTIVVWNDFQCPFCARLAPPLAELLASSPQDVRLAWKDMPLPFHPTAVPAAIAARAAGAQGKFWQMHD